MKGTKQMQRLRCGFSHDYAKLYGQTRARLLDVKRIDRKDIDELAVVYDTRYRVSNPCGCEMAQYPLEDGPLLRMTFIGDRGIPFTTYRTDTPEHFRKYADNIGKVFEIYIKEGAT